MSDKEWLLNAAAIKAARRCIKIVDEELGVRLTLSHPDFLSLLEEYSQLTDSLKLLTAVRELSNYASPASVYSERSIETKNVVAIGERISARSFGSAEPPKSNEIRGLSRARLGLVDVRQTSKSASSLADTFSAKSDTKLERRVQSPERRNDMVPYHGKHYRRWNSGKEFQGLYRGRPRYA